MKIQISTPCAYSAMGRKENQEDSLYPLEGQATALTRAFLVCDGMGGHEHGEVASACVADTVGKVLKEAPMCGTAEMKVLFEKALAQAYQHLDALDTTDSLRKMGTTLTCLMLCSDGILTAHIGDSRIYQFRPGQGVLFHTRDHSLVNDLIAAGELSEEEAKTFPQRNVITRAIQPHQEYPAKASYNVLTDLRQGDLFLLCCDGVLEQLDDQDLCSCLLTDKPLEERLQAVRQACEARNTRDNHTAYLIEVASVEGTDTVELVRQEDGVTTADKPRQPQRKRRLWWIVALAVVLSLLIVLFLFAAMHPERYPDRNQAQHENVQGPIHRNAK